MTRAGRSSTSSTTAIRKVPWPKRCGCGASWWPTRFRSLESVGIWRVDDEEELELRNCVCGSTIAVRWNEHAERWVEVCDASDLACEKARVLTRRARIVRDR